MRVHLILGQFISTVSVSSLLVILTLSSVSPQEAHTMPFSDDNFSRATAAGRMLGNEVIDRYPLENHLIRQHSLRCGRILVAEGDSWLDYPDGDIATNLEERYWAVYSTASRGDTLASMLYDETQLGSLFSDLREIAHLNESFSHHSAQLDALRVLSSDAYRDYMSAEERGVEELLARIKNLCNNIYEQQEQTPPMYINRLPKAIVLSAGGNDLVFDALSLILEHRKSGADNEREIINNEILSGFLRRVQRMISMHISAIDRLCKKAFAKFDDDPPPCKRIPILLHGYDYARASGEGYKYVIRIKGPWLQPTFAKKGHMREKLNNEIIEEMIDRYNTAICNVVRKFGDSDIASDIEMPVFFLNFRREVQPSQWNDEIHPGQEAFGRLADKISKIVSAFHSVSAEWPSSIKAEVPCINTQKIAG